MKSRIKVVFADSARNLHNLRAITIAGMLLALHVALSVLVNIPLTNSVKLNVSFATNVVVAQLCGPWMALITGALGDILQFVIKPTGAYFPGWTLNSALVGFWYGVMLYQKTPKDVAAKSAEGRKAGSRIRRYAVSFISVGMMLVWALLPFVTVTSKVKKEMPVRMFIADGSALDFLRENFLNTEVIGNDTVALGMLLLLAAILLLTNLEKYAITLMCSVIALLWLLLPAYTNRNQVTAESGFIVLAIGFAVVMLMSLWQILAQKSVDARFLFLCFFTLLVNVVCVQMFLGTYWCTVMYGKGFWYWFTPRAIKSIIQLPFNTVLIYYLITYVKQMRVSVEKDR